MGTMKEKVSDSLARALVPASLREKMERMKALDPDATDSDLVRYGLELLAKIKGVA